MAISSVESVRIANETGTGVVSVDSKGVKNALAVYLLDESGNPEDFNTTDYKVITTDNVDGDVEYVGWAVPGTSETSSLWRIAKVTYTTGGNPIVNWADSVSTMTKQWSLRATYNYG